MRPETTIPVVRQIPTNRADVFAFTIEGHLTSADIENVYGLLEGAYEQHDKIDLLVRLDGYEGFDWNAAFKDTTLSMQTRSLKHIRRYAIVGGPTWIHMSAGLLKPFLSIEMKTFDSAEEAEAWKWIGAEAVKE
ncbi:STAS/SEC14 domain-containing protein [Phyllobacterium salinisoli]|uniref:STAS/SEC14 domain-containing protein n=1 Tax=Phyllobacterium salinisoli TaxID=1899321 RepID=A0A368KAI5_9HYPH|nr:STAS/SEC14 domain-containing protein [Phyllobacterium salinisoli]RCS25422.1 STAS/SEC14 domain-containing protein [Phyllobacterium salinisoli]